MFQKPILEANENSAEFERVPFIKPTGFREYDARWVFGKEINLLGITAIGVAMAALFKERGVPQRIVVGHDYRWYSSSIKQALINGLLAGGMEVHDIGLALSPMAYFAQFDLDVEGVAMVTASHNDNGWTGIKMGLDRPLTFGPDEMSRLKEIVYEGDAPMPVAAFITTMLGLSSAIWMTFQTESLSSANSKLWLLVVTGQPVPLLRRFWKNSG